LKGERKQAKKSKRSNGAMQARCALKWRGWKGGARKSKIQPTPKRKRAPAGNNPGSMKAVR